MKKIKDTGVFTDLRKAVEVKNAKIKSKYTDVYPEPISEDWDKVVRVRGEMVNLYRFTCTCEHFTQSFLPEQQVSDLSNSCVHLFHLAKKYYPKHSRTIVMMRSFTEHGACKLIYRKYNEYEFYIGVGENPEKPWVRVFFHTLENDYWSDFSFNTVEKRWSYNSRPECGEQLEMQIFTALAQ